jgi:putative ABC transport system permease protein
MATVPLRYNIRSLIVRRTTTLAAVLGIALVVAVVAAAMMLVQGVKRTMGRGGRPDVAMVLRKGSDNELSSNLDVSQVGLIMAAPGVVHDGIRGVSEAVVVTALEKLGTKGGVTNVQLRGASQDSYKFRDIKIVAGRAPRPGSTEAMVGERIRGRFAGLDVGQSFDIKKNFPVQVVGVFSIEGGSSYDSEVWLDVDTLRSAFGRTESYTTVSVKLESPSRFAAFKTAIEADKRLGLSAIREDDYYTKQSEGTAICVGVLGGVIAFFFSIGAMIGAMITMYGAIANREREIGTLRALGFSRFAILFSFVTESVILAAVGGLLGALVSLSLGSVKVSMMNMASWSEMVFSFEPSPSVIGVALLFACGMGLFGGFFPAWRAAFTSPVKAMRG